MQRGGFDIVPIKNSDFKYTIDRDRIVWAKNVFPIAEYIVRAIVTIPWSKYIFEGESVFWTEDETTTRPMNWLNPGEPSATFKKITANITAKLGDKPRYYFFGGSVYEILNNLYSGDPRLPNLHSFVDPTGDMDVLCLYPEITFRSMKNANGRNIPNHEEGVAPYFFKTLPSATNTGVSFRAAGRNTTLGNEGNVGVYQNRPPLPRETQGCTAETRNMYAPNNQNIRRPTFRDGREYNELLEHYSSWIMERFAENISNYKRGTLFHSLFGNTVPFNLDNNSEGRYADRVICIDNLKIVRAFIPDMNLIKIQLIAKYKDMTHADHICEFLIQCPSNIKYEYIGSFLRKMDHKYQIVKGIPMSNFQELIDGNVDSIKNRYEYYDTSIRHKFFNHVKRMMYIQAFLEKKVNKLHERDPSKITLPASEYANIATSLSHYCFQILDFYESNREICNFVPELVQFLKKKATAAAYCTKDIKKRILQRLLKGLPEFILQFRYGTIMPTGMPVFKKKGQDELMSVFTANGVESFDIVELLTLYRTNHILFFTLHGE